MQAVLDPQWPQPESFREARYRATIRQLLNFEIILTNAAANVCVRSDRGATRSHLPQHSSHNFLSTIVSIVSIT